MRGIEGGGACPSSVYEQQHEPLNSAGSCKQGLYTVMTDTSKEQDAYRDMYLQNWTFILHGRGNNEQGLRLLSVCRVHNAHKCLIMVSTNAKPRSSQMPEQFTRQCRRSAMSLRGANIAGHVAHNRRSLALTKAGDAWRSQMWVSMHLTVNLPDHTFFESSSHPSVRLSTTLPVFYYIS